MSRRGFTILEVIIGLSLLIVLVAGAYGMLLQLHTRQREIARYATRNTVGTTIIDALERALLTCVADGGPDGPGVSLTGGTVRIVYRDISPDLPTTQDAFASRARLAIIHNNGSGAAEITVTHGGKTATTTIPGIERIRFRAHAGEGWTEEFDTRRAGRLPAAVEIAIWFSRPGGSAPASGAIEATPDEPRAWREPDRLRVIAVFDSSADESFGVGASSEPLAAGAGGSP